MRIGRHSMFMEIAHVVARRGTCPRLCVGALIVVNNRIVSHGYNGAPAGEPHCIDVGCLMSNDNVSCKRTIHAEANALKFAPIATVERRVMYVTNSPCKRCVELIIDSHIEAVYFDVPYRDTAPIARLSDYNIKVYRVMPNGYIIEGRTGDSIETD